MHQKRRGMKTARRFAIAVPLVAAIFGCATSKDKVVDLPGGGTGYYVSCSNSRSWDECFSKAGNLCSSGYEIISRQTEGGEFAPPTRYGVVVAPIAERIMVIKCI
jgi:hypothetical protein